MIMNKMTPIAAAIAAALAISPTAFAHQTYNLTGAGLGINNSVNNTDGVSNTGGYGPVGTGSPVRVAGTNANATATPPVVGVLASANANIPGTGGLPADYSGALPYNLYHGHHDATIAGLTVRNNLTGTSAASNNSLWKAYATQDATFNWGSYLPTGTAADHPFVAVGSNSWVVGSTTGGLDYNLIHASAGANDSTANVTTASAAVGGRYEIAITIKRDTAYDTLNDPAAKLDVALYRGADNSITANRTAAFDPNAAGVQGSSLGIGNQIKVWSASQTNTTDTLTYTIIMDAAEFAKTDAVNGTTVVNGIQTSSCNAANVCAINDGDAGYYTLVVGAHGGAANSAVAYTIDTISYSRVPEVREDNNGDAKADLYLRDGSGNNAELFMNGFATTPALTLSQIITGFDVKGRGDYSGDGVADLLWGNTAGALYLQLSAPAVPAKAATATTPAVAAIPAKTASAATPVESTTLTACSTALASSTVVASGDFNNDTHSDILFFNSATGVVNVALMNGSAVLNPATGNVLNSFPACSAPLATLTGATAVKAIGDFNGDGKADIAYTTSTGTFIKYMGNATPEDITAAVAGLFIQGAGSYNATPGDDIVLADAATSQVQLMDGATPHAKSLIMSGIPTGWAIQGTGDYNGSGAADIFFHNDSNGGNYVMLMSGTGTAISSQGFLSGLEYPSVMSTATPIAGRYVTQFTKTQH